MSLNHILTVNINVLICMQMRSEKTHTTTASSETSQIFRLPMISVSFASANSTFDGYAYKKCASIRKMHLYYNGNEDIVLRSSSCDYHTPVIRFLCMWTLYTLQKRSTFVIKMNLICVNCLNWSVRDKKKTNHFTTHPNWPLQQQTILCSYIS